MGIKTFPVKGDVVKVVFDNGLVEEGVVVQWAPEPAPGEAPDVFKAVLKSPSSDSVLLIPNINRHVVAVKICVEAKKPTLDIVQDVELEPSHYERDESLRAKNLAELYQKKAEEERRKARELLTTKEPSGLQGHAYDIGRSTIPRNLQPVPKYPKKKTRGMDR
jgi:hypothetical protein